MESRKSSLDAFETFLLPKIGQFDSSRRPKLQRMTPHTRMRYSLLSGFKMAFSPKHEGLINVVVLTASCLISIDPYSAKYAFLCSCESLQAGLRSPIFYFDRFFPFPSDLDIDVNFFSVSFFLSFVVLLTPASLFLRLRLDMLSH